MRLFLLVMVLGFLAPVLAAASAPSLDGHRFAIELVEEPSGKPQGKDTLVFAEGFGDCQAVGKKYGYAKGLCTVVGPKGGKPKGEATFRFTMTSAEHGDLLFEGRVQGAAIEGKRTWSKPGKEAIVHRFTGVHQ